MKLEPVSLDDLTLYESMFCDAAYMSELGGVHPVDKVPSILSKQVSCHESERGWVFKMVTTEDDEDKEDSNDGKGGGELEEVKRENKGKGEEEEDDKGGSSSRGEGVVEEDASSYNSSSSSSSNTTNTKKARSKVAAGTSVGTVCLWEGSWQDAAVTEIGWGVATAFQGRGFGTRGVKLLLDMAVAEAAKAAKTAEDKEAAEAATTTATATATATTTAATDDSTTATIPTSSTQTRTSWGTIHAFTSTTNAPSNAMCKRLGVGFVGACDVDYEDRLLLANHYGFDTHAAAAAAAAVGSDGV